MIDRFNPGFDDVIYPVDYKVAGHIVDDEMHDILYEPIRLNRKTLSCADWCQGQASSSRSSSDSHLRLVPFGNGTRPSLCLLDPGAVPFG